MYLKGSATYVYLNKLFSFGLKCSRTGVLLRSKGMSQGRVVFAFEFDRMFDVDNVLLTVQEVTRNWEGS